MKLAAYTLQTLAPLSIESGRVGIPSDILFAGVAESVTALYGAPESRRLLEACLGGRPPFLVSSAFPWRPGVRYWPRRLDLSSNGWEPEDRFREHLSGRGTGGGIATGERSEEIWKERFVSTRQRLFRAVVYEHGLWLAATFSDPAWRPKFEGALRLLGDSGIGARRSVGWGAFRVVGFEEVDLDDDGDRRLLLSLCNPSPSDSPAFDESACRLVERSGPRSRKVRMLAEGSVIQGTVRGRMVDVASASGPSWRFGFALAVPCRALRR